MIVQESFLKKLRSAFDLNIYEVKIWTALLSKGIATAGELSDISNVPRSRSYDVLESLEKKGFIIMKLGKPIKYIAVQPEEIVKRVKKSIRISAEKNLITLDKVREETIFKDIELLYKQGIKNVDITNLAGSLKGRDNLYNHLETMLGNAKENVTIVTSPDGFLRKVDNFKAVFGRLAHRGVKIKIAVPVTEDVRNAMKELKDIAEVRNLDKINARFVIVDGKEIAFMVVNDKDIHESYDTAIWVNTPFFANALSNLFESTWQKLTPV